METNNPNQPVDPSVIPAQPPPVAHSSQDIHSSQKSIWKTDAFIVLALVIFWPVGLFLMWKYAPWRKWVKGVLTFFFLLGALPLLLIWGLLFGLKGYSLINNTLNPRIVNQSKLYTCQSINTEWGRCRNTKHNFSFEYPANWNYIDLRPEGIGFSPANKNLEENFIISMGSPGKWDTKEEAKEFADGYFDISKRQKLTIDGFYATKDYNALTGNGIIATVVIVDGNMTYQFTTIPDKLNEAKLTLSKNELQEIFEHMANSFKKEN